MYNSFARNGNDLLRMGKYGNVIACKIFRVIVFVHVCYYFVAAVSVVLLLRESLDGSCIRL